MQLTGNVVGRLVPNAEDLLVAFLVAAQTHHVFLADRIDLFFCLCNDLLLLGRDHRVADRDGQRTDGGILVALCLDVVQQHTGARCAVLLDGSVYDLFESGLAHEEVHLKLEFVFGNRSVNKAQILRDRIVEDDLADGGFHQRGLHHAVDLHFAAHLDFGVQLDNTGLICHHDLVHVAEHLALAALTGLVEGEVVGAEDHILRRHRDRLTVGGLEQVACRQHEEACLCLRLCGERHVHRHLVAVKVGVERGTNQRMQLDGAALYEHRLKCLDAESVQGWRTVEHDGMTLDDDLECVPNVLLGAFHGFSCGLDVLLRLGLDQALHHKRLEQLQRHLLGQTALVHLQLRADDDDRTAGVVNTLAEQVLTEASLLALQHIGKGFERAVVGAGDGSAASAVVDQRVNGFLQHALFVADNDFGRVQLEQLFETVVAVDHTAVEVVEVACRKTAAVELYHRTDVRRNDRHHVEDHPLGTVARQTEALHHVQALEQTDALLTRGSLQLLVQLRGKRVEVDLFEQQLDGLGAHACLEVVLIFFTHIVVFGFGKALVLCQIAAVAGVGDDVLREVEHILEHLGRDVEHERDTRRNALEVPDVGDGSGKLDVTHALASDLGTGDLDAAAVADLALETDPFIFAAVTLPVLGGSEDALAEQTLALGLECAVVDGFGLFDLTVGPRANLVGRSKSDFYGIKNIVVDHIYFTSSL